MDPEEIIHRLEQLQSSSSKLELSESQRSQMMDRTFAYTSKFITDLNKTKGYSADKAGNLEIKNDPSPLGELLDLYQSEVVETGINAASPKHMGYIPGGGVFTAALADYIAAVTNPYSSVYFASPGATTIENEVINWLKSIFSFPENSVGCLSSGGSISTMIALTAARDKYKIKNGIIPKSVIYLSGQVHHSIQKSLRIIGLEDVIIRMLPLDDRHRMVAPSLEEQIQKDKADGLNPYLVVGTAGTTDTGAIDPLDRIADIAKANNLWFHVDAAYGGFFILTSQRKLFKGMERADSFTVDPHKGLFLPYGVGAVLIKDAHAVLHSHYYTANYMQDGNTGELSNSPANLSPELTKHFRGLRVWLPLRIHGIEPFTACLEEKLLLVRYFRNRLAELNFCLGPDPDLSVSYFWYPFDGEPDKKNRRLMEEIHRDGTVFLSSSIIDGRFVIRIAILAFRTRRETVDQAVEMIVRCLKLVQAER